MTYKDIAWEALKWLIGSVIIGGLVYEVLMRKIWMPVFAYFKAISVTRRILKNNRPLRNGGGKYTADRLLDLWNNGTPMSLVSRKGVIYKAAGRWPSVHWENVIDEILEKEGLVVTYEKENRSLVRLSETPLSRYVLTRLLSMVDRGEL